MESIFDLMPVSSWESRDNAVEMAVKRVCVCVARCVCVWVGKQLLEREDQQEGAESLSRESVVEFKNKFYRQLNINKYTHTDRHWELIVLLSRQTHSHQLSHFVDE